MIFQPEALVLWPWICVLQLSILLVLVDPRHSHTLGRCQRASKSGPHNKELGAEAARGVGRTFIISQTTRPLRTVK